MRVSRKGVRGVRIVILTVAKNSYVGEIINYILLSNLGGCSVAVSTIGCDPVSESSNLSNHPNRRKLWKNQIVRVNADADLG